MFLPVDATSGLPIYRQIRQQVGRMVAAGTLKPGERVPSVRDLAGTLAVNPLTVAKAYGELEREGILESRRGLGMFVAENRRPGPAYLAERMEAVRATARRLALEALQAGLSPEQAARLVAESWKHLEKGKP